MRTKEEQRRYQREWVKQRRLEWIQENGPCALCGSTVDLEVDHRLGTEKELPSGDLWSLSKTNPRRIKELSKCQVLCHVCHVKKTYESHEYRHGVDHPRARLTETDIREIRKLYAGGLQHRAIAKIYDTNYSHVARICRREVWRHVS